MDPTKVEAIQNWSTPKIIKKLRGFLGLSTFYRKFVKGYAGIATPLTDLTKKDAFKWNDATEEAFKRLKEALTTSPILASLNFDKPFILECDASGMGIGVVLIKEGRSITFKSCKLNERERLMSTYNKEMLAIMHALHKWRQYLLGSKFKVKIDHSSLKHLLHQEALTDE